MAVYLAVIFAVMLWRGVSIEPHLRPERIVADADEVLGGGRQGERPELGTERPPARLDLLEIMRGFAAKTGFAPHDVSGLERAVFAGTLPTVTLQHWFYDPSRVAAWDVAGMMLYFLHFPVPLLVGFVFWWNRREHYWRFVAALLLMCFLAFITYHFWPSDPPWYINKQDGVVKIIDETIRKWGVQYFVSPVYTNLNPNKFAAFPSLHAAFPALGKLKRA